MYRKAPAAITTTVIKICNLCRVIILNSCQIVESLQLHSSRAQFEPGEILKQERAVSVAILLGEKTLIGAGEDGGQFLQFQQVGIERIDEGIDGFFEVFALDIVIAFGQH